MYVLCIFLCPTILFSVIRPGTKAAEGLTPADLNKRMKVEIHALYTKFNLKLSWSSTE